MVLYCLFFFLTLAHSLLGYNHYLLGYQSLSPWIPTTISLDTISLTVDTSLSSVAVIVTKNSNPLNVPNSNFKYWSYWSSQSKFDTDGNGYYVLYTGEAPALNGTVSFTFSKTALPRTYGGVNYSVVAPESSGTYYLVAYLYSRVVGLFHLLHIKLGYS